MELKKTKISDNKFVDEMLILGYENNCQGYAYPRGDLEDLENELNLYDLKVTDCIYLITENENLIGIVGFIKREANRGVMIGPVFSSQYHTFDNVNICLRLLLDMELCKGRTITNNILNENKVLSKVLLQNNFIVTSSHITMRMDLGKYSIKDNITTDDVLQIYSKKDYRLSDIDDLLKSTVEDWAEEDIDSLKEYLEDGYEIAVLKNKNKIIGTIIWIWFEDLGYGRIEYVAVHKSKQRKGYGSKLIDYVLVKLKSRLDNDKYNYLYLDLNEENKKAYELYLKKDFAVSYFDSVYKINN